MDLIRYRFGDLRIEGESRAGTETWFRVFPPGLAFDAGRGALPLSGAQDLFLSHGHLDHALGTPYVLSQRSLHQHEGTRVFCPREIVDDLGRFLDAAARLERVAYRFELRGLAPGDRVEVGRDLTVEAFANDHVVPSLGYFLWRSKSRLAREHVGKTHTELQALREAGVEISETVEELALAYCGDTGPGVFDAEPRVFEARVLLLECTFLDPGMRDRGGRYKHVHLLDLAERQDRFANEYLVLHHLSRRHTPGQLARAVAEHLPALAERIHIVPQAPPKTRDERETP